MTSRFTLDADLDFALRLADAAREISLARFRGSFQKRLKADGSIVTEVDEAVEDELRELLARERPADAILGEERGASGSGERRWIIDAIDGTLSFAAGETGWGTLIALEAGGDVVVGVCDDPARDRRSWAVKGRGAFRTEGASKPRRLQVSGTTELERARSFVPPPGVGARRRGARDGRRARGRDTADGIRRSSGAASRVRGLRRRGVLHGRPMGPRGAVARGGRGAVAGSRI